MTSFITLTLLSVTLTALNLDGEEEKYTNSSIGQMYYRENRPKSYATFTTEDIKNIVEMS